MTTSNCVITFSIGIQLGTNKKIFGKYFLNLKTEEQEIFQWFENEKRLHILIRHAVVRQHQAVSSVASFKIEDVESPSMIIEFLDQIDMNSLVDNLMIFTDYEISKHYEMWKRLGEIFKTYGDEINRSRFDFSNVYLMRYYEYSKTHNKPGFFKCSYDGIPPTLIKP